MKPGKRKERPYEEDDEFLAMNPSTQKKMMNSKVQNLESLFSIHKIDQDGNCLFRSILYFLCGADKHHKNLRESICDYILEHQDTYSVYFEGLEEGLMIHIEEMKNIGVWGTIIELYAASELFAFNFIVYNSNLLNVYCSHIHSDKFPTIYLHFVNRNHFDLLF